MRIYAIGIGPGDLDQITPCAEAAIRNSEVIVGYSGYMELIAELTKEKTLISTGMTGEAQRCEAAIAEARKGKRVCVISSGDAGIYGMASLLYELCAKTPDIEIEVIPGITAAVSAAAILGSPLANDFAAISLSDLLTPWDVIEKRLDACGAADMVLCIYNPMSSKRREQLRLACDIVLRHRAPDTKCGYVRNAFRGSGMESHICTLDELAQSQVDMFTTVIIGNTCTQVINGKLVTTRGYVL